MGIERRKLAFALKFLFGIKPNKENRGDVYPIKWFLAPFSFKPHLVFKR